MIRKLVLFATLLVTLAPVLSADVILTVDPAAQTVSLGSQATVTIQSALGFVGDFDIDISWNPAIVSLFSIGYGSQLGVSIANAPLIGAGTVNASEVSLEPTANLMALQPGGSATLLTLVFDAIGLGTSPVNVSVVAIGDELGLQHQLVDLTPGSITVAGVPEPSSMLLLASVAGLLGHALRKRRT